MLPSLILQLLIDVLLVGVIAWLWLQQKRSAGQAHHALAPAEDKRLLELERAVGELRANLEGERKKIQSVLDRIQKLIEQGALTSTIFPMSQEEEELKSLSYSAAKEEAIPTLKEFESTRERLSQEVVLDLRTLLRDQLA